LTENSQIDPADPTRDLPDADQLFLLVYEELRKLAFVRLADERVNHTLQPTALVHEVYLQLTAGNCDKPWASQGHFFAAAAEAMRRILIQSVRQKRALKRGGGGVSIQFDDCAVASTTNTVDLVALNDALELLIQEDSEAANMAMLRLFAGLSVDEAGAALGLPHTSAYRSWNYANAWLKTKLQPDG
jgi:RNA polymerase sigma factor (TIGR02999 family)